MTGGERSRTLARCLIHSTGRKTPEADRGRGLGGTGGGSRVGGR